MAAWERKGKKHPDVNLLDVTTRYSLLPKDDGSGRIRFHCPYCTTPEERAKKRGFAQGYPDAPGTWWCFKCTPHGGRNFARDIIRHFGDEEAPPPPRVARRQDAKKPAKARLNVAAAWKQLTESWSLDGLAAVEAWAHTGRGWPADVAAAVAQSTEIAFAEADVDGSSGRALARKGIGMGRRLLFVLRDAGGRPVSVARRWAEGVDPEPADGGPKSMGLKERDVGSRESWGGLFTYGSIAAAVEAARAGRDVYFVEGGPDFAATEGLIAARGMNAAVVGCFNAHTMPKAVAAFAAGTAKHGIVPRRVVIVPHVGDDPMRLAGGGTDTIGIGERMAIHAADALRGRAGVYLAALPVEKGDVADVLRDDPAGLIEALSSPKLVHPAPIAVANVGSELLARARRAVIEATQTVSTSGKRRLVVFRVDPGAGKTWAFLQVADDVASGAFGIPVNRKKPKGWVGEWPPDERRVAFATPDHSLAAEKEAELLAMRPEASVVHRGGLLHYCRFSKTVGDIYPAVGRYGVCGTDDERCEWAEDCEGSKAPKTEFGDVTLVPHASVPFLKPDLAIIDESPGVVETMDIPGYLVDSLSAPRLSPRVKAWRRIKNPDAGDAAVALSAALGPLAKRHAAKVASGEAAPYSVRVSGADLVELLGKIPGLIASLRAGFHEDATPPPKPLPSQVRDGFHRTMMMPSSTAFKALRHLLAFYERETEPPLPILGQEAEPPPPQAYIRIDPTGEWALEVRRPSPLPDAPVIVLDATGDLTLDEWKAAYPDRVVSMHSLPTQGTGPADACHFKTRAFMRSRLLYPDGRLMEGAAAAIQRSLSEVARRARVHHPRFDGSGQTRIGVLTHKPVADALRSGGDEEAARVRTIAVEMSRAGFELQVGHFGKDDRGTNAFKDVHALVILGDPRANLGAVEADAHSLGLELADVYDGRTAASAVQAIYRARHTRRDADSRAVLVYAGMKPPDVPGIAWETVEAPAGGPIPKLSEAGLTEIVSRLAREHGAIGVSVLRRACWDDPAMAESLRTVSNHAIAREVERVRSSLGMKQFKVRIGPGRPPRIYAPSEEGAEAWAARQRGENVSDRGEEFLRKHSADLAAHVREGRVATLEPAHGAVSTPTPISDLAARVHANGWDRDESFLSVVTATAMQLGVIGPSIVSAVREAALFEPTADEIAWAVDSVRRVLGWGMWEVWSGAGPPLVLAASEARVAQEWAAFAGTGPPG